MTETLEIIKEIALKAGEKLLELSTQKLTSKMKEDRSFVTNADLESEKIIIDAIKSKFPQHSIYSEEKGHEEKKSEYCWYIDPVDGTHNFMRGMPLFAVSIALAKGDEFILGVVYIPRLNELYYAEKNKGAFMNNLPIHVSSNNLKDSVFYNTSSTVHQGDKITKLISIFLHKCGEIRMNGSCVIDLCFIASGKGDFKIMPGITPWDTGAGKIILEEAGGKLTKIDGSSFKSKDNEYNFIASNSLFHDDLIKIYKEEFLCKQ